ncbi:histone H1-like [Onychostoma macrolepis]|nr:histone H1-like [Onychostoma macrolepis]
MAVHELLLQCLEDLDSEEMDSFKWHLTKIKSNAIPKSQLEKKSKCAVVECMIQRYHPDGAGKRTLVILKKMRKMNLAEKLQEKLAPKNPVAKKKAKAATAAPKNTAKSSKKATSAKPKAAKPKAAKPKKAASKKN